MKDREDRGICVGFSGIGVKRVIMSPYMPRRSDLSMTPDILSLRSLLTIKRILDGNNIHGDCLPISKEQVFVFSYYWFWNSAPPSAYNCSSSFLHLLVCSTHTIGGALYTALVVIYALTDFFWYRWLHSELLLYAARRD
ncbi:hypothetical protein MUK42_07977 [Musa troglodytarum]|uniref:Uncharacterized protein n=1 Tax=Musa troglodytarum TaxID=320322 RepID=A0A9E7HMW7_9LILI|nr:hypothetical protein MUK42_07977 [Musa troglodytarum]